MKTSVIFLLTVITLRANAASGTQLSFNRNNPLINCEISQDQVTVKRKVGGVEFIKTTAYKIDDLRPLILKAYANRIPSPETSEYSASMQPTEEIGNERVKFRLNRQEPNSLKIMSLITSLCELR